MAAVVQTAANVIASSGALKTTVVAGGTVTAGMPVYKDAADSNKYKSARANALGTADVAGIALNGASNGQPLQIQLPKAGTTINLGGTLAVGETYCLSDAVVGQIVPHVDLGTGDYPCILGVASTASLLDYDHIIFPGVAKA